MKKFKKISAVVLATGLLASTSIQVLANENEKVETAKFETVNLQDALNNVKNELTSIEDLKMIVANIPSGLFTNNIFALSNNLEKINNPNAKLALQKNLEKAIAKYEEKTADDVTEETTEDNSVTETPVVVVPVEETEVEKSVPETEEAEKQAEKAAKLVEKQERKAAQQAKKEERKAAQQVKKEEHKATQQVKKEEHKENKVSKKEAKDQK